MAEVSNSKLLQIDTGIPDANACIIIIRTEWNTSVVDELEKGCRSILEQNNVKNIIVVTVPGVFEIPFGIKSYWDQHSSMKENPCAFIALGCVIRGDTPHFEYVCRAVTDGVVQLNLSLPVPTVFGILTVNNEQQALERIGGKHGHKGEEAALTAIKMIGLKNSFKK